MQLARVIGDVVDDPEGREPGRHHAAESCSRSRRSASRPGRPLVAVDAVGAGVGEEVFFVRGKEASFPFYPAEPPVDAGIVGIVDHWDLGTG